MVKSLGCRILHKNSNKYSNSNVYIYIQQERLRKLNSRSLCYKVSQNEFISMSSLWSRVHYAYLKLITQVYKL